MSKKIIPYHKFPRWFKLMVARVLIRCLSLEDLQNDIVLYNELNLWIKTKGRPTTSNPNYWVNKK